MARHPDPYSELHRIARRRGQRGYFTSVQAPAAGMSRMQLSRLVKRGLVLRAAPSVYHFRIAADADWKDRLAIELLATGGTACGLSAAALHGLVEPPARPRVLVPRGSRQVAQGRHTSRVLQPSECVTVDGLIVTSRTRPDPDNASLLSSTGVIHICADASITPTRTAGTTSPTPAGCASVLPPRRCSVATTARSDR